MTAPRASLPPERSPARRPRPLRVHLLRIALAACLPLLAFAIVLVALLTDQERDTFRRGAEERTLALLTAVDTELKRSVAALEALATSDRLRLGELAEFYEEAVGVLESREEWLTIHLALPDGVEVLNLLVPLDTPLHRVIDEETFHAVKRSYRPAVGNLIREPLRQKLVYPVRVPVLHEGNLLYVLTALVEPAVIAAVLSPQGLPESWVGVVLDRKRVIVARTVDSETRVGKPASASLQAALSEAPQGWFRGHTIEGWPVYTPYHRSAFSGWTVALGIPAGAVQASLLESLSLLIVCGLVSLGAGIALAWLLGRRATASLRALGDLAGELGAGRGPVRPPDGDRASGIAEVERLMQASFQAARLIEARSAERDRVEASLRAAQEALRESDRRKDEFMAMLGHELRNPLGVISTSVQLLRLEQPDADGKPRLGEIMQRQVTHMARLLDDLLDASRIAAGRVQLDRRLCDFVAIARQTAEDYRGQFAAGGIDLAVEVPDHPLWVDGDAVRLAQVVGNLLHNANKFTDAGGRVTLRIAREPDPDEPDLEEPNLEEIVLTVTDSGAGMDAETLGNAFQAFRQADRTIERSRGGLGLGLALVKGLVELHGGSVAARSAGLGRGSELTVRLPFAGGVEAPADDGRPATIRARPARVLVIEDNRLAAETVQMFLRERGHSVEVANTGPEGVAAAERSAPDVVLCDIGLPGADGYQVARELRRGRCRDALLIAVTGYGQQADRQRAAAAGFDRFLTKPIDLAGLERILAEAPVRRPAASG